MVVVIVLETGITGILVVSGSSAFPFAIGAGFSERLLARVMNAVESAAEK